MKQAFIGFVLAGSVVFSACNNDNNASKPTSTAASADSAQGSASETSASSADSPLPEEKPSFSNVDPKTAASLNEIVSHYLHIKNALFNDNGAEAAAGAKALVGAMGKVDHAALAPDQMKLYMDVEESLKEHAEHTADNAGKIDHQREHFVLMSNDVYDLVKGFGTDKPLYVDHCPMANDNKGANWLSETREIRNPYMGQKMPKCGSAEKVMTK
jgi:hypothetical protein